MEDSKKTRILGQLATIVCILMYVSYISMIMSNLHGNYVNPLQPAVAFINSILWCLYAVSKPKTDWPVFISNVPGIVLAFVTVATSLPHYI